MFTQVGMLVVVNVALAIPAAQPVQLSWRLREGETFFLFTDNTTRQKLTVSGRDVQQDFQFLRISRYDVAKSTPEQVVLRQTIESVTSKQADDKDKEVAGILKRLEGAVFTLHFDGRMQLQRMEGYDVFLKAFAGDNSVLRKQIAGLFHEDKVREEMSGLFGLVLPEQPVAGGAKWQSEARMTLGPYGFFTGSGDHTLQSQRLVVDGKTLDRIDVAWSLRHQQAANDGQPAPFRVVRSDLKIEDAAGTFLYDPAAGKVVLARSLLRFRGNVTAIAGSGKETEMAIEQETIVRTRMFDKKPKLFAEPTLAN